MEAPPSAVLALLLLAPLALPACGGPDGPSDDDDAASDDDTDPADDDTGPPPDDDSAAPPFESLFTFAVVTDSHVTSEGENQARLAAAVAWIEQEAGPRGIELVLVTGDIAWGAGLDIARQTLDGLSVPYVPLMGDNEVQAGDDAAFEATFGPVHESLAGVLDDWRKAEVPVWHPEAGADVWLQNLSFTHRGVRFVGLDWCARGVSGIMGEIGAYDDIEDGTPAFLAAELEAVAATQGAEGIVLASHIPMHDGAFVVDEMEALVALLAPHGDLVHANYAGHVHVSYEWSLADDGYEIHVTDATWDDEVDLRLVKVEGNGSSFAYTQELIAVPWE